MVLGGDIHAFAAADIHDRDRPDDAPIAVEFVGGSITSLNNHATWPQDVAANPSMRFVDHLVRGCGLAEIRPGETSVRFRGLADAREAGSGIADLASFVLAAKNA